MLASPESHNLPGIGYQLVLVSSGHGTDHIVALRTGCALVGAIHLPTPPSIVA